MRNEVKLNGYFFEEKISYLDFVSPVKERLEVKENLWLDISVEISYF